MNRLVATEVNRLEQRKTREGMVKWLHREFMAEMMKATRGFSFCLVGFLTSSSTTRLYRGQDRASDNFTCCHT